MTSSLLLVTLAHTSAADRQTVTRALEYTGMAKDTNEKPDWPNSLKLCNSKHPFQTQALTRHNLEIQRWEDIFPAGLSTRVVTLKKLDPELQSLQRT